MSKVYRVEFTLSNGIACDMPVMLDALVAKAYLQRKGVIKPVSEVVIDEIYNFLDDAEFPLSKSNCGRYFLASHLFFNTDHVFEQQKGLRKSFPVKRAYLLNEKEQKRGIDIQRGEFRSVNDAINLKLCSKLIAWFCGDLEQVKALLSSVTNIGKKKSIGLGEISGIDFFEDEDVSFDKDHLRPIPLLEAKKRGLEGRIVMLRLSPPYHQKQGQEPCVIKKSFQL